MRLKRNVKKFFRLITRRRVLGLLGLFGVGAYAFLDPTNENIHRAVRSVRSTVNQVKFEQPVVHDEPKYMLPPTDDSLPECPYETADLRKFSKSTKIYTPSRYAIKFRQTCFHFRNHKV